MNSIKLKGVFTMDFYAYSDILEEKLDRAERELEKKYPTLEFEFSARYIYIGVCIEVDVTEADIMLGTVSKYFDDIRVEIPECELPALFEKWVKAFIKECEIWLKDFV